MTRASAALVMRKILLYLRDRAEAGDDDAQTLYLQSVVICDRLGVKVDPLPRKEFQR